MSGLYDEEIINNVALEFLDAFQETYERLPTTEEYGLWKLGFLAGCNAIKQAIVKNRDQT